VSPRHAAHSVHTVYGHAVRGHANQRPALLQHVNRLPASRQPANQRLAVRVITEPVLAGPRPASL